MPKFTGVARRPPGFWRCRWRCVAPRAPTLHSAGKGPVHPGPTNNPRISERQAILDTILIPHLLIHVVWPRVKQNRIIGLWRLVAMVGRTRGPAEAPPPRAGPAPSSCADATLFAMCGLYAGSDADLYSVRIRVLTARRVDSVTRPRPARHVCRLIVWPADKSGQHELIEDGVGKSPLLRVVMIPAVTTTTKSRSGKMNTLCPPRPKPAIHGVWASPRFGAAYPPLIPVPQKWVRRLHLRCGCLINPADGRTCCSPHRPRCSTSCPILARSRGRKRSPHAAIGSPVRSVIHSISVIPNGPKSCCLATSRSGQSAPRETSFAITAVASPL